MNLGQSSPGKSHAVIDTGHYNREVNGFTIPGLEIRVFDSAIVYCVDIRVCPKWFIRNLVFFLAPKGLSPNSLAF